MPREERPRKVQHHWIQDVVAENVKAAMKRDGRSAEKLGRDAKVGRKSVERLRAGENSTLTTLGAVADALGLEPIDLLLVRQRTNLPPPLLDSRNKGVSKLASVNNSARQNKATRR